MSFGFFTVKTMIVEKKELSLISYTGWQRRLSLLWSGHTWEQGQAEFIKCHFAMKYMLTDFLGGRALHAFGWKYGYYNRKNEQYRQTNPKLRLSSSHCSHPGKHITKSSSLCHALFGSTNWQFSGTVVSFKLFLMNLNLPRSTLLYGISRHATHTPKKPKGNQEQTWQKCSEEF